MSDTINPTIGYILRACDVTHSGAMIEKLRRLVFADGRLQAFNGMVHFQAPSGIAAEEQFSVSEEKLASAVSSCGETAEISVTKDFLRVQQGPFKVRVRKLSFDDCYYRRLSMPKSAAQQTAVGLRDALREVQDFISTDASRPWSCSAMVKEGYVWATNNLSLVRAKVDLDIEMRIPVAAVRFLCELPSIDHYHIDENRLLFNCGKIIVSVPQSNAEWPDVSAHFKKMPKKLSPIPDDMKTASRMVGRFSERFTSLSTSLVQSAEQTIETDYEVDFAKGKGQYNAKLLTLILEHATHADFSSYPEPIYFRSDKIEGTAVGIRPASEPGEAK